MKKTSLYIVLAAVCGLFAGYLFFADTSDSSAGGAHDHNLEAQSGELWTCSMHPQILQPEPGDCPICGMDLIPSETVDNELSPGQFRMTKNALALADIQTTVVGSNGSTDNSLKLSGTIEANAKAEGTQASYFKGRIEALFVNFEGEEVRNGQKLATLYAPELVSAQQELITAAGLKTTQPELYSAVRNKLKLWKLSDKQISEIEKSGKVQEYFPIYATVSGTVSEIMVKAGDYVDKGTPLFRIANLKTVWAVFDGYENQVPLIKEGQRIEIISKAYPNTPLQGQISFINPVLNASTRTVEIRADLKNPDGKLKPGMFVTGNLKLNRALKEDRIVIPESAVLWTGERSVVYVKTDSSAPVFEMREIEVGDAINGGYIVLSGLESGAEIVTQGAFTVDATAQLKGKKSMMNDQAGPAETKPEGDSGPNSGNELDFPSDKQEMSFTKDFQRDFIEIIPLYLKMKDALVKGDAGKCKDEALAMAERLDLIQRTGMGETEKFHLSNTLKQLRAIGNSDSLESQRAFFVELNESLIPILQVTGSSSQTLFVQTCPMANNNKGAIWLSAEKEVRNPYYGDAMLACGSVINTIQ